MKKRMNEPLSAQSAVLTLVAALLLILLSATIAKAVCSATATIGCDVNCTQQVINDCPEFYLCVFRSCEMDDCSACPGRECGRSCAGTPRIQACGGCVDYRYGCKALAECCPGGA
jgi:hypothetical protein